jgi:hypothetical protein
MDDQTNLVNPGKQEPKHIVATAEALAQKDGVGWSTASPDERNRYIDQAHAIAKVSDQITKGLRRIWRHSRDTFTILGRVYEGADAGLIRVRYDDNNGTAVHSVQSLADGTDPIDDDVNSGPSVTGTEHHRARLDAVIAGEPHGPLAAHLSDRTMEKVLSRPSHVPSLVMLDRNAAAQQLADAVTHFKAASAAARTYVTGTEAAKKASEQAMFQALADYRETTA